MDFAESVRRDTRNLSLSESFEGWARAEGATQFGDQTFRDAFAALPEEDPSRLAVKAIKKAR